LISPNSDDAFQAGKSLVSLNPPAWKAISGIPSDQIETESGLWTWSTAYPLKVNDTSAVVDLPHWLVVSQLPANQLRMIRKGAWTAVGINTLILLLLFGVLSAWLARALSGRARALVDATRAHVEAEAAKRLSEVHQRFRLVAEANATGLLVVDSAGRIVLTNPALERMFGYTREELVGQPMEMLLPESERGRHGELRADYLKSPQPRPMGAGRDLHGRRRDGSILPVEISLSSFTENGERFILKTAVEEMKFAGKSGRLRDQR
jgi:PAS domain S-box-containing protein